MAKAAMVDPSEGLAAATKRRNRISLILAGLMLLGGVIGFFSAMLGDKHGGFLEGIPASWAVIASLITVVGIGYGSWRYHLATDELDRRDTQWASTFALNIYIVGYAVWYLWWRGGLVREPMHEAIFVATMVVMMAAYGFKKIKP
jgi:peptidoglycan/LPS O-acetylase OafA/YrhL